MSDDDIKTRFVLMEDYGCEGWAIVGRADSMLDICRQREAHLQYCGSGRCEIFEHHKPFAAYGMAQKDLEP